MKNTKLKAFIPWTLLILCTVCYVSLIFNRNVWMDEAFTASLIDTDMAGVISRSMHDTLPPLYNILLKLVTDVFGYTVPVMKAVSVLPMILSLLLGATVIRRRHGLFAAAVFMLCLTAMPFMLFFGVEIRMYSLGFFFATASAIYAYEVLCDSTAKNWTLFTLFSVLAGYSHHFAFVTVGMVYFFLLLYYITKDRAHIRRWLLCLLATFVLYLPCLVITIKQIKRVSGYFSMPAVTFPVFVKYLLYPFNTGSRILSAILVLFVAALFLHRIFLLFRNRQDPENGRHMYALLCLLSFYGVLLFGTAVSKIMTANIFVDRYLFFACALVWLFFAIEVSALPHDLLKAAALVLVLLIGVCTYRTQWKQEYSNDPSEMIAYLAQNVHEGDGLSSVSDSEALYWCLHFYNSNLRYSGTAQEGAKALSEGKLDTVWIAVDEGFTLPDLGGIAQNLQKPAFAGEYDFDRYHFTLYKLQKSTD